MPRDHPKGPSHLQFSLLPLHISSPKLLGLFLISSIPLIFDITTDQEQFTIILLFCYYFTPVPPVLTLSVSLEWSLEQDWNLFALVTHIMNQLVSCFPFYNFKFIPMSKQIWKNNPVSNDLKIHCLHLSLRLCFQTKIHTFRVKKLNGNSVT